MRTASRLRSRVTHRILVPLVAVVLLAGCTGDADGASGAPDSPDAGSVSEGPGVVDGADPFGVLLAVVVLTTGDVDAAVAEGLVTPAELDTAREAIVAREVSAWLARADLLIGDD